MNDIPSKDFKAFRGLSKVDSLSPFIFVIVCLIGLLNKVDELEDFKGFKVNDEVDYHILQFADNTMLVGDSSWKNIWSFNAILSGFELVLGLKIYFARASYLELIPKPILWRIHLSSFHVALNQFLSVFLES